MLNIYSLTNYHKIPKGTRVFVGDNLGLLDKSIKNQFFGFLEEVKPRAEDSRIFVCKINGITESYRYVIPCNNPKI